MDTRTIHKIENLIYTEILDEYIENFTTKFRHNVRATIEKIEKIILLE